MDFTVWFEKVKSIISRDSTFNLLSFLFFLALVIGTSKLITNQEEDEKSDVGKEQVEFNK